MKKSINLLLSKHNYFLIVLIIFGSALRLLNLNWDGSHYLHPDERLYVNASNITFPKSLEEFLSPESPLNPNMFYYGTFPLYTYKLFHSFFSSSTDFLLISRFISAFFSIATIPILYFIGKKIFSQKIGFLSAFIFTFAPGSIQYAHFNTTESILVFLLCVVILLSAKIIKKRNVFHFILLGISLGLSYATKIVGLTYAIIPSISFFYLLRHVKLKQLLLLSFISVCFFIIVGFLIAPYQIIDFDQFSKEQKYMQGVTYGKDKPPFVLIYENTTAYLYPLIKILPYTFGFLSLPIAMFGFIFLITDLFKKKGTVFYFLILIYPFLYFAWAGAWYAKFARYYILLFPFLAIWGGYFLSKWNKVITVIILTLIAINGLLFINIYLKQNTRIEASQWIYENIPSGSLVATEHWDDSLPLLLRNINPQITYTNISLSVYDPDTEEKITKLSEDLSKSDFLILSSRRVYFSILENRDIYPYTSNFYTMLFKNKLGFSPEKQFVNHPFVISDDFADESFQSYDHPPVVIYKNTSRLSSSNLYKLIKNEL